MSIIKPLDVYLDFTAKDIVSIPCTQYDKDGRTLNVHFLDNGKIFLLDKTIHELKFKMTKKDGKIIFNSCTINDDGTATYVLTEQTCVYAGVYDVQFMLINLSDESVIHTMPAKLNISKTVADNIQIESSDEFDALNEIFFRVGDLEEIPEKLENLSQGIVDETTRAIAKEAEIETKLNQEITRATSKEVELEKTLSDKIDKTTIATSSTLGLVKSGSDVTVDASGNMSVNDNSHKHTVSNISDLTVTANELNVLDGITSTTEELNSTKGVTSNIQEQLNSKVSNERTVNGKSLSANINLTADDVGADVSGSAKAVQNNLDNHINNSDIHFTSEERTKLKGIAAGANKVTVDSTLSSTSTNPVQNKVVHSAIANEVTARDSAIATAKSSAISTAASDATAKADKALASAKSYTDTKTASLASTTVVDNKISTHNTSTSAHSDIRNLISELTTRLNALADSDDTTLDQMSEIVAYIKANKALIDSVTTNKINISDIVNNLTTNVSNKPLSAAQGVVIKGLINVLQSEVDSKANSTDLTSHTGNTSIHVTASEKATWNNKSDFSGSYNDLTNRPTIPTKTSQLINDSGFKTTDTVTTVTTTGTGNAITSLSATNGAITATKGSTFLTSHPTVTKGTDSTSTASPSAGRTFTAIDSVTRDGNGHVTKVNTKTITLPNTSVVVDSALSSTSTNPVQNKVVNSALAGKASSNHTHSTLDGLTATIAELNYCDGVTSNIQTQLNNKSSVGHTHDVSYISGVLPVSKGGTGQANANSAANALMNALSVGDSDPQDADYFISQYAGGGTTNTTYHRRPISALWNYIKSKLATVATSGSYNDLSNKPTIGNGTVTIKQAGTSKGTFTMNQSGNTTIELTDNNTTYGVATQSANGLESAADKKKLDGIATGAEVNQNAFSNVKVGETTIAADSKTDSLTLAGSNVTLTPDATNDKVTIGITKANVTSALGYTPPTTNTTYGVATSSALGLVKSGTDITVDSSGNVSVNDDSHNHVISNVDGLQTALDGKASSSHTHSSYVNQNAFSNVTVGSTTIAADTTTDTLTLVAGSNVTITPDATNDKITISSTNTWRGVQNNLTSTSTTESLSANQGKILNDTKLDKTEFNNLTIGGRNLLLNTNQGSNGWFWNNNGGAYALESVTELGVNAVKAICTTASTSWGVLQYEKINRKLLKKGGTYTLSFDIYPTVNVSPQVSYCHSDNSCSCGRFDFGNCIANTWTHCEKTITFNTENPNYGQIIYIRGISVGEYIIANLMLVEGNKTTDWTPAPEDLLSLNGGTLNSGANITIPDGTVTATSFVGNLNGQASSAAKLSNTSAIGSATNPVYFNASGVPVKTTYTLGASVPSDAKFTDTTYTHPTTSGNKHIPSGGSSGQILRWSADGTATWGNDNNSDTKATQTNTTTAADYRVVLSTNANDTTETGTLHKSTNFTAVPSTGAFYAKGYNRTNITGQTLDINTLTLSTGSPEKMRYIEKTSGGSANITNIPVTNGAFILDVELVRWASSTDYISKQIFISVLEQTVEYVRWCTNGTWGSWTKRVFTDNNTTYTAGTGIALSGTQINHSNSVTAATAQGDASKTLTFGGTFTIPTVTYDAQGHITAKGTTTMTMPASYTLPTATASVKGGVTLSDSTILNSTASSGVAATPSSVFSVQTQLDNLTTNIQQNDVIAKISSSSSSDVTKNITILSKDYRAFIIVLCNGYEADPTVINTYTWLSSMVNGYYRLDLYDPSNNVHIGYIEFLTNSIFVYLNKYDEYYVDIYGLISL